MSLSPKSQPTSLPKCTKTIENSKYIIEKPSWAQGLFCLEMMGDGSHFLPNPRPEGKNVWRWGVGMSLSPKSRATSFPNFTKTIENTKYTNTEKLSRTQGLFWPEMMRWEDHSLPNRRQEGKYAWRWWGRKVSLSSKSQPTSLSKSTKTVENGKYITENLSRVLGLIWPEMMGAGGSLSPKPQARWKKCLDMIGRCLSPKSRPTSLPKCTKAIENGKYTTEKLSRVLGLFWPEMMGGWTTFSQIQGQREKMLGDDGSEVTFS